MSDHSPTNPPGIGERLPPIHPGEILKEAFLVPMGLSERRLARAIGVPEEIVNEFVRGQCDLSVETARRLSGFFGLSDGYWTRLQQRFDAERASPP